MWAVDANDLDDEDEDVPVLDFSGNVARGESSTGREAVTVAVEVEIVTDGSAAEACAARAIKEGVRRDPAMLVFVVVVDVETERVEAYDARL